MRFFAIFFIVGSLLFCQASANSSELVVSTQSLTTDQKWQQYLNTYTHNLPSEPYPYPRCFQRSATVHDLPLTLLLAVARGESNFDPRAVSSANAIGLMQILWPGTANHLGINRRALLFDPCVNVDAGARYLNEMLTRYNGNLHRALAAYNYGPGRVPLDSSALPGQAAWYSGYIFDHLDHVLGDVTVTPNTPDSSSSFSNQQLSLITFDAAYRARAFVKSMQQNQPALNLYWYKTGRHGFDVVMQYRSTDELAAGRQLLERAGFTLTPESDIGKNR